MKRNRPQEGDRRAAMEGRLVARTAPPSAPGAGGLGLQALGLEAGRDGWCYVPTTYRDDRPAPLVLMLHGAGGSGQPMIAPLQAPADAVGLILLALDSRDRTWDVLLGGYGPDIAYIDRALAQMFSRYAIDPTRLAVGGFSDGASYALSIGLTNGDLFTHVIAFSPGFMTPAAQRGAPRIFVSHGTHDRVLPIDRCSRRIVPQLERAGYDLVYQEFDGPHTIPPEIAGAALEWFMAAPR